MKVIENVLLRYEKCKVNKLDLLKRETMNIQVVNILRHMFP
jgi:hypothetical protein